MCPIHYRYLPIFAVLCPVFAVGALAAELSLGQAVKKADSKYLDAPEIAIADTSPKIIAGGGEEGSTPVDREMSLPPLRVTLTYVEEEPEAAEEAPADDLPGDLEESAGEPVDTGPEDAAVEIPPLEDIPEEAMLPGETGLGETVWRAAVVTIYFDDPNAAAAAQGESAEAGGDKDPGPPETADQDQAAGDAEETAPPAGPRAVATLKGDSVGFGDPPVSIQIAELDPNNPYPEVVVSFYTGGAHCCSSTSVVTSNADGSEWTVVDVGEFDGGPLLAVDLDGDGTYEFETRDNAFLYAFACYACSEAPLQVLALKDGEIEDVSEDPRFKPAHAAWLKNMIHGVPEQEVNGFLAGYVGEKIRLGEGKQAWQLMLKYYDRNTDWGLEVCEPGYDEQGECPEELTKTSFPEALEHMLNENGYKIED